MRWIGAVSWHTALTTWRLLSTPRASCCLTSLRWRKCGIDKWRGVSARDPRVSRHLLPRDYNSDADKFLTCMDPEFQVTDTQMWADYKTEDEDNTDMQVRDADQRVSALNQDARKAQYEADTLALARDLAQVGAVYKQVVKSENAARCERILHLRSQNTIGAALVQEWMCQNCAFLGGNMKEQVACLEKAGCQCFSAVFLEATVENTLHAACLQPCGRSSWCATRTLRSFAGWT